MGGRPDLRHLSGGERQRIRLGRAVAQQAPLVILDEPTNHLDVRAPLDLLALVYGLGVTVLAALHDLDQAAGYADQVAVVDAGTYRPKIQADLAAAEVDPALQQQGGFGTPTIVADGTLVRWQDPHWLTTLVAARR